MPVAALVGRQNVGKSALFNLLAGQRHALVSPIPGTTRDMNAVAVSWRDRTWELRDTGGLELSAAGDVAQRVRQRVDRALAEADLLLFVTDGQAGITAEDKAVAQRLRSAKKPVLLIVNKLDTPRQRGSFHQEVLGLGFGEPALVSAKSGSGSGDLLDEIVGRLPATGAPEAAHELSLLLLGKPNVGKSSLMNRLLGFERSIVSHEPHTTRDPQAALLSYAGQTIRLIDTAGFRRQLKLGSLRRGDLLEKQSVDRGLKELERADIVALILDASQPLSVQDRHLADRVATQGCGVLLVANKWDLVPVDRRKAAEADIRDFFPFLHWAPLVTLSAKTGSHVDRLLQQLSEVQRSRTARFSDRTLERFMKEALRRQAPTAGKGRMRPRLLSFVQTADRPPRFLLTVGARQRLQPGYVRYFERALRERFDLVGTPLAITVTSHKRR